MPVKMKNRQKITRVQLQVEADEDYILLGVVSSEPDYKLSLSINRKLNLSLQHKSPVELIDDKGVLHQFSRFRGNSGLTGNIYNLISNKSGRSFFLKRLNKIDYLFLIYSPENDYDIDNITNTLRSVESITAVFPLESGELKDKNLQYLI